jgi:DNA polymerase-1
MPAMSRELVRLVCDSPLPQPLDELEMKGIPDGPLRDSWRIRASVALLARLNGTARPRRRCHIHHQPSRSSVTSAPRPKIDRSAY